MKRLFVFMLIVTVLGFGLAGTAFAEHPTEHPTKSEHPAKTEDPDAVCAGAECTIEGCPVCAAEGSEHPEGTELSESEHPTKTELSGSEHPTSEHPKG